MERRVLSVVRLAVVFHEEDVYEVEHHDLFELFARLGLECLNILAIRKNAFFVVFAGAAAALEAFRRLNNHLVEALRARLSVQLCLEAAESSFPRAAERFRCVFELEVPELPAFDAARRLAGVDGYNFERLRSLCDKEFFEGAVEVEPQPPRRELRVEC